MLRIVAAAFLGVAVFGEKHQHGEESCGEIDEAEWGTKGAMLGYCGCFKEKGLCDTEWCYWVDAGKDSSCNLIMDLFNSEYTHILAKGDDYNEKAGKIKESKKSLKRKLKKMVKKAAKVETKLKALKEDCKRRRIYEPDQSIPTYLDDPEYDEWVPFVGASWGWGYPSAWGAEGESYSEVQGKIKGMFNGLSKSKLKAKLDKAELDVKAMKKEYKKEMKKCDKYN